VRAAALPRLPPARRQDVRRPRRVRLGGERRATRGRAAAGRGTAVRPGRVVVVAAGSLPQHGRGPAAEAVLRRGGGGCGARRERRERRGDDEVVGAREEAVPRRAVEVAHALHCAVVLAARLVELDADPLPLPEPRLAHEADRPSVAKRGAHAHPNRKQPVHLVDRQRIERHGRRQRGSARRQRGGRS